MPEQIHVIFRMPRDGGEVEAFFPFAPFGMHCPITVYSHAWQHAGVTLDYYRQYTKRATPDQYRDLLAELKGIYGDRLRVIANMPGNWERAFSTITLPTCVSANPLCDGK